MRQFSHANGRVNMHDDAHDDEGGDGDGSAALAYVIGDMEPAETLAFERRMEADAALRSEVEVWRVARESGRQWIESDAPGIERLLTLEMPEFDPAPRGALASLWGRLFPGVNPWKASAWCGAVATAVLAVILVGGSERADLRDRSGSPPGPIASAEPMPGQPSPLVSPYGPGSSIHTRKEYKALFQMSKDVRCAMNGLTKVDVTSSREIALNEGEVWLWVAPSEKDFKVKTPHGTVSVTGTSFGVSVAGGSARVETAEGSVSVAGAAGAIADVAAGREASLGSDGSASGAIAVTDRSAGTALPAWVSEVEADGAKLWVGAFLPSIGEAK